MRRHPLRALCLAALAVGAAALAPAHALELTSQIVRAAPQDAPSVLLRDGDVIRPGAELGLKLSVDEDAVVSVRFRDVDGTWSDLLTDRPLAARAWIALPDGNNWYRIDTAEAGGSIAFEATARTKAGLAAEVDITLILAGEFQDPIGAALTRRGGVSLRAGEALPGSLQRTPPSRKTGAPTPTAMLDRAARAQLGAEPLVTRGAGAAIFREKAAGVVLVATEDGIGSGALIDADGRILTNWHVVAGYTAVGAVLQPPPGQEISSRDVFAADVVKVDEVADLALLRMRNPPEDLTIIPLGSENSIEIGGDVHAIGHPQGETWTYTRGYVSQIRSDYRWITDDRIEHNADVVQTQTPINPGNSGGPLLDVEGMLIGINSFRSAGAEGLNFAVSVGEVLRFLDRTESRFAERIASQPESAAAAAAPSDEAPDYFEYDTDENGVTDLVGMDWDKNGVPEIFMVDLNEDEEPDGWVLDSNENGEPDGRITIETLDDGRVVEVWMFDEDEDGEFELAGVDYDRDGEIDRYKELG